MPRPIRTLLVLLVLAPVVALAADEEKKAPETPKSDPAALAVLDKAIAHQAPKEFAGPESIKDLFVRIQAEVWDYRGEKPKKQSVNVSRYLTKEPRRFRSEWRTSAGVLVNGNDGRFFWFAEWDAAGEKKQAQLLTGNRYKDDRQRIEDERAETEYLLRFFFLGNLKGEQVQFTKKPDETIDAWGKRECFVLHRVNHDATSKDPALTLWFEKSTHELVRAVAHARTKVDRTLRFSFLNDEQVQPRVKGVLFPFKLELHEKSEHVKEYRILTKATLEENGIDFNSGLDAELFVAPVKKEK